ncbi:hypothetical protein LTR70_007601 [Exophiala xenobiotica]|uniref:Peptidase metallopeptidase domain-containing protein n=1 Tax=Lithohypha guttulata TaxID=1690604 RepID=A0ABR0KIG7_9EURO|nr:hypothetical protein LTR24_002270 [Lithohypha guttulata]KAK5313492.1 hypothetical protein LTR70_007601 [Exophiala xenobiotica]
MAQNIGDSDSMRDMCIQFISPQPRLDMYPEDGPLPEPVQQSAAADRTKTAPLTIVSLNQPSIIGPAPHPIGLALPRYWFWRPGRTIRVYFMNGAVALQNEVMGYASEWEAVCNLKFQRVTTAQAEIRISLADGNGYNSSVGTSCYDKPSNLPTMHLSIAGDQPMWRRHYVLHEFGHAIGCVHEQSSPAANIVWNIPAVEEYYGGSPNYWTKDQIYLNVLHQYTSEEVVNTTVDTTSIMAYKIPARLTLNGFSMPLNMTLSDIDKEFIAKMYGWKRRDVGMFRTMDMPNRQQFQQTNIQKVDFYPPYLSTEPRIAMALNWIDCGERHGQRIRALEDKVTTTGMEVHVDSWSDTALYGGGVSWMEFESTDVRSWQNPAHPADDTKTISFDTAFQNVPNVILFLRYVDIDWNTGTRLRTWTESVTMTDFRVHINTWSDTTLYDGGVSWVAYDPLNLPAGLWVESGTLTNETFPTNQQSHSGSITFSPGKFEKPPTVLLGIPYFDFHNMHGTRMHVDYANVTKDGMDWFFNSWADSICYGMGISWLAVGDKA